MSVLVAAALDATVAEPPAAAHPVVWTGRYLDVASRRVPAAPRGRALLGGAVAWTGGALVAVVAARAVPRRLRGIWLWPLLSLRMLLAEVRSIETALQADTEAGRAALARIVSRDTADLGPEEIRGGAIESLSENLSDSLVAPLFWYLLAGLPGAALYRFANTADACWGYRSPRWEYAGRFAARADDALNLVPARITAALLFGRGDWVRLRREAGRTDSPNAGWPMAAMALRLDVRLPKRDHYVLHAAGADPAPGDVERAVRLARRTAVLAIAIAAATEQLSRRRQGAPR